MIHPNTQLKWVEPTIGFGVFATQFIPMGTIVYVIDELDIKIGPNDPLLMDPNYKDIVNKYSYIDEEGNRIISWDHAKFVNHCCNFNTISTGYGFEIAVRDIQPGEEITDEYGTLNIEEPMPLYCCSKGCRKWVSPDDLDNYYQEWDKKIIPALKKLKTVEQPLMNYLDLKTKKVLFSYLKTGKNYASVLELKYNKFNDNMHTSVGKTHVLR